MSKGIDKAKATTEKTAAAPAPLVEVEEVAVEIPPQRALVYAHEPIVVGKGENADGEYDIECPAGMHAECDADLAERLMREGKADIVGVVV